jgi:alanine-glyoxylate transaminase/serine-glyoxylate transaminase/serine-pyruvate transaminase
MIPGPVELSPAVLARTATPPPSHVAPELIESFGASLERMRAVWLAPPEGQPFVIGGGGTVAMEMAVTNLVAPGERAVVIVTGSFSDRMSEMLRVRGADVVEVRAAVGDVPPIERVCEVLDRGPFKALFATHVDTSTGVVLDAQPLARAALERGVLSVFDGVCATAGERFDMDGWGADVYLTASQKALGLPPGLALCVASERALEARGQLSAPPPVVLDWLRWQPIMRAYEERRPSYFSTPPTNLVLALETALGEILERGIARRWADHRRAARAMRAAWTVLGLRGVPLHDAITAHTLSALALPPGIGPSILARIREHGVIVAGGLHPEIRERSFRVGHMGYAVTRPDMLQRTILAIGAALRDCGLDVDASGAGAAAASVLEEGGDG